MTEKNAERLADIFAMVTFSFVTGMIIEMAIAEMTLKTSLISRGTSIPLNIVTARPYGIFRNWLISSFKPQKLVARMAVDFLAFISFQVPVYIIGLLIAGANLEQMMKAVASVIGFFMIMGPPYGVYLEQCRRLFKGAVSKDVSQKISS
jgi:hypothetical protein